MPRDVIPIETKTLTEFLCATDEERLADTARRLRAPSPGHRWRFDVVSGTADCGTVGCAVGLVAAQLGSVAGRMLERQAMADYALALVFGFEHEAAAPSRIALHYNKRFCEVTPRDVAAAIEAHLAR